MMFRLLMLIKDRQVNSHTSLHCQDLTRVAPVDARGRPAFLPVREPAVLRVDRLEPPTLQRAAIGVLYRSLNHVLAVRIRTAAAPIRQNGSHTPRSTQIDAMPKVVMMSNPLRMTISVPVTA